VHLIWQPYLCGTSGNSICLQLSCQSCLGTFFGNLIGAAFLAILFFAAHLATSSDLTQNVHHIWQLYHYSIRGTPFAAPHLATLNAHYARQPWRCTMSRLLTRRFTRVTAVIVLLLASHAPAMMSATSSHPVSYNLKADYKLQLDFFLSAVRK
jgi:hypothetical protein